MSANDDPSPTTAAPSPAESEPAASRPASSADAAQAADPRCERCNAPIRPAPGFPALCDRCIELAGSCCCE